MTLWFLLFTSTLVVFGSVALVWWRLEKDKRRQQFTRGITANAEPIGAAIAPVVLKEPPAVEGFLSRWFTAGTSPADAAEEAGWSQGGFVMLTGGMAVAGLLLGTRFTELVGPSAPLILGVVMALVPWRLRAKRRKARLRRIEEQFPDALDFLSRTVRAGNAFSVGLELLAGETSEPLKTEIVRVTREMALGAPMEYALDGLLSRIPLFEVRFFVSAVLLQRETGGNLSEVLGKLAISVRERLRLRGQVKAASGQGRLTAIVLTVLPIITLGMIEMLSPEYLGRLTNDPLGRNLLAAAAVSQILGYVVMKMICNIEV